MRTGVIKGHESIWRTMELSPILTVVVVIRLYVLTETHRTVHTHKEWIFRYVNYTSIKKILMRTISSPWWGAMERFIQHVDSLNGLAPYHSLQLAMVASNKDDFLSSSLCSKIHISTVISAISPSCRPQILRCFPSESYFFSCAQHQNLKIISSERDWGSFWAWIKPNHFNFPPQRIRHVSLAPICSKTAN